MPTKTYGAGGRTPHPTGFGYKRRAIKVCLHNYY